MAATKNLFTMLKSQKVVKADELNNFVNHPFDLRRLVEAGEVIALGAGYYCHQSIDPVKASFIVVARFYPDAVISNISALHIHGLTDQRIDRVDVDIERSRSIRNQLIKAHRVNKRLIKGIIQVDIEGCRVKVYSKERALCDIFKNYGKGEVFYKALKRYIKSEKPNSKAIATFDQLLKTEVLDSLAQELADE